MPDKTWDEIKKIALQEAVDRDLGKEYKKRLLTEIEEIDKQDAGQYIARNYNDGHTYDTNNNGLVIPWLLGMTEVDPLNGEHEFIRQTDWPDIDVDCISEARDHIKKYAADKYGEDQVCSVGIWQTYKFKSAIKDVVRGTGGDISAAFKLTESLPAHVDDLGDGGYAPCVSCEVSHRAETCPECGSPETEGMTLGQLLAEEDALRAYYNEHPETVEKAIGLIGKIKSLGKHAGGIVISKDRLWGNVPMEVSSGHWTSLWTEGRSPQLSKLGYIKWDLLGLRTLQYIHGCCKMVEETRGCKFNPTPWDGLNPEENCAGYYWDNDGEKHKITLDDPDVFEMINDLRVETIFQFETDVQREVLSNGVRDFSDLQIFNAMGHPGPIACIPDYVKRRDDESESWREEEHPKMVEILEDTYGIIVYQEQLQAIWQKLGGFTAPEAEAARKAIAKKWTHKLKEIEEMWYRGAVKSLGKNWATKIWDNMKDFGRYAFNKSHSCSYITIAYWCAWLKTHFAPEWWASVMSHCHSAKMEHYMNVARFEGVKFGKINVNHLSPDFTVDKDTLVITPGLTSLKRVGSKIADEVCGHYEYSDVDDFVDKHGKNKTLLERLIKLGAFANQHSNRRATWKWYLYKYASGKEITKLRHEIRDKLLLEDGWNEETIKEERERQKKEYFKTYPNRRKTPNKIKNWTPDAEDTRERVMGLYEDDYTYKQVLEFEKEYLGYYWHSPMEIFEHTGECSIEEAKEGGVMEAVVDKFEITKTRNGNPMGRLNVTDGVQSCTIFIWEEGLVRCKDMIKEGDGLMIPVDYDEDRSSFTLRRGGTPVHLNRINEGKEIKEVKDA